MIKNYFNFFLLLLFSGFINAQTNILNAKKVAQIGQENEQQLDSDNDGPIPYGYVDDRDVMWSKVVWEKIDLNQKINLPFYFPTDTSNVSSDRRSLFDVLVKGIRQGKITEVYDDTFFITKFTSELIEERLKFVREDEFGSIPYNIGAADIKAYLLKGMWYFDKRQGEMKYRLLGIAPLGRDVKTLGSDAESDEYLPIFWVFYPSARDVLHESKVFNPMNNSNPISYDHLLNARRFSSVITREENIYGNREISKYVRGNSLFQLLEADKIKEDIRNREIDMWNY
ncbi:gliding motility protein GldN [Polaribacter litorisediminis]|uniref:type IX secretion system ring protein PorN/GldN n=1 Tax=Polaribacter litorisediminis TaxID=1908341 RepID=UPI001CBBC0AD|nr:gliding motility protein GldN [Polaribacter litorisediminis]UAM96952.1 gliding motility protein GldN [Polaribacter litorisediminis]